MTGKFFEVRPDKGLGSNMKTTGSFSVCLNKTTFFLCQKIDRSLNRELKFWAKHTIWSRQLCLTNCVTKRKDRLARSVTSFTTTNSYARKLCDWQAFKTWARIILVFIAEQTLMSKHSFVHESMQPFSTKSKVCTVLDFHRRSYQFSKQSSFKHWCFGISWNTGALFMVRKTEFPPRITVWRSSNTSQKSILRNLLAVCFLNNRVWQCTFVFVQSLDAAAFPDFVEILMIAFSAQPLPNLRKIFLAVALSDLRITCFKMHELLIPHSTNFTSTLRLLLHVYGCERV